MSPRSSNVVSSISTGSRGVASDRFAGYLNPTTVGGVVSAPVGSRCAIARRTSSLRVAWLTCSRPKPSVTVSRVDMIAPPLFDCAGSVA